MTVPNVLSRRFIWHKTADEILDTLATAFSGR
jgi:hypothetical protein